jgi:phosphoglucomutase
MDKEILARAKNWANNSAIDLADRKEIQNLLDQNDTAELNERFYRDLEFGTGGLRSILGMGQNRMNKYNVRKATQALCTTIIKTFKNEKHKLAISYDSRHFSFEFAKEVASVCAGNNVEAFIYERMNPVALLSFSVRYHKAHAGVMVTASHNPPKYNGYKCYWNDGAQVTPPNDVHVINEYNAIVNYDDVKIMNFDDGVKKNLIHWVGAVVENKYYDFIKTKNINFDLCQKRGSELKIVYTPIHGTGLLPCTRALKDLGLTNIFLVEEQTKPDGNFPTVKSPNPENPEALALAVKLLEKENADIAMGSDPDTDRLGVVIPHKGQLHYLNGNQIGTIMIHYIFSELKKKGKMPTKPYFVKTIVTTPLQDKIAAHFGVDVENTLTGFKWICGRMNEIERTRPDRTFLFGTEESFGYLNHDQCRDKDGVSSVTIMAEIALYYKTLGMTVVDALDKIYEEFGFSHEVLLSLDYEGIEGTKKISRIMEYFRKNSREKFMNFKVERFEDYENRVNTPATLPLSNVLGLICEKNLHVYLRPSGTEPKIKFYVMLREDQGSLVEKKKNAQAKASEVLSFLKTTCEGI